MSNPFAKPAPPGEGIKWADLQGALLIIEPFAVETGIQTAFGPADAVRARVSVVDGEQAGTVYEDTLIFPKVLSGQVKGHVGGAVLGRLMTGAAKPNQSPPWLLAEASQQDEQVGVQFLQQRDSGQLAAPAPAQQKPPSAQAPQQQWGQQPTQQQPQQPTNVPF